jgi:hypothetical protein
MTSRPALLISAVLLLATLPQAVHASETPPVVSPLAREAQQAALRMRSGGAVQPPGTRPRSALTDGRTSVFAPGRADLASPPRVTCTLSAPNSPLVDPRKLPATLGGGGDGFGTSLTTLGDVYGDGTDDFAVSAPYYIQATGTGTVGIYKSATGGTLTVPTILNSNQTDCLFGWSISTAGDVNGDGYPDLLVGAPGYDVAPHPDCGRVYLYLGNSFGYSTTPSWQFDTPDDQANTGWSVAWAGDVNRDGFDDWLVGAPYLSNGSTYEGRAYLFYGGAGVLSTTPAWSQESDHALAYSGFSVAGAGDVNGDGYADFLVGAPGWTDSFNSEGSFALYLGTGSTPAHTPARSWFGGQLGAQLGRSVSTAGDVSLDGYSDFIVGAPYYTVDQAQEGVAFVYEGGPVPALYAAPTTLESNVANAEFGWAVGTAGDVNGDGIADVVVGAPLMPQTDGSGKAFLFLGTWAGISGSVFDSMDNVFAGEALGRWVGTLGDISGDGRSDWGAGAPSPSVSGNAFFRLGDPVLPRIDFLAGQGLVPGRNWGLSGATADVDGDGYDDLIVGTPNGGTDDIGLGVLTMFRGGPHPFPPVDSYPYLGAAADWTYEGQKFDEVGISLANAGDVNRDGFEDFIAGGFAYSNGQNGEGEALLFYGSPSGPSATPFWRTEGNQELAFHGWSVAGGGDLNGDGYDDVAVGAPQGDQGLSSEGLVSVYLGSAFGLAHEPLVVLRGNQFAGLFGVSAAIVGDVNRDGYDDLVVGAHYHSDGQTHEGKVFVYLGSATGIHAPASQTLQINVADALFGWSVARIGDVNGDGYADMAVGAPGVSNGQSGEGEVFVYYGSVIGFVDPPTWSLEGNVADLQLGYYGLGSGGDFNGDGYGDFLLGTPYSSDGALDAGSIDLFMGGPAGLSTFPLVDLDANIPSVHLGTVVGGDGDFNGDGATDLFYTAPGYGLVGADEGVVGVMFGNMYGVSTMDRSVSAWRADGSAPIATGLRSDANNAFRLKGTGRSAAGRTRVRLEWEVKPLATPFDLNGRARTGWQFTGGIVPGLGSGSAFNGSVTGLGTGTAYRWRARYRSASPFFPTSPWIIDARRRNTERDLSTAGAPGPVAVDPETPGPLALAAALPNPSSGNATLTFTLPRAGKATLALYDVSGRLVRTVFAGPAPAGPNAAVWDGRDDAGRAVAAGAYFERLLFEDQEAVGKVVRLR